ncbi:hypothetical protein [Acinetobacter terrae]|nr:hypothetical protein [Acinetobacter terrae]
MTVADFVFYDSILTHAARLCVIPPRFTWDKMNQPLRKAIILPCAKVIKT